MARYRSGTIRLDVSEVIDEISDDDLLDAVHDRRLSPAQPGETVDLDIVREAYVELNCGRLAEARVILERLLFPKWKNKEASQNAYEHREKLAL